MIYIGPAGVPLSCKGRTTLEGVQHVQELGLNAMEIQFVRGIRMDEEYAVEVGELAKQLGVKLGVHSPYYTNICSDEEKTHERAVGSVTMLRDYFVDNKFSCKLGIEVMGKQQTVGDLDQVIQICKAVPGTVPIVDFAHIHARTNGGLKTKE